MSEENLPKIIDLSTFHDDRGKISFNNDFNLSELGIKRFYTVSHVAPNYIRAFHGHLKESKYCLVNDGYFRLVLIKMNVVDGKVLNFEDDLQLNKNTFVCHIEASQPRIVYIPKGYYNGFMNLTPTGQITFYSTSTTGESEGDDYRMHYQMFFNNGVSVWTTNNFR